MITMNTQYKWITMHNAQQWQSPMLAIVLGTQWKMNYNNNVQWTKVTMKCSKKRGCIVKICETLQSPGLQEMKKLLSCWKGKMTFPTFASVVICAKIEALGPSNNRNVYLSILDAEAAPHNYAPKGLLVQWDFSSLNLMYFLAIKDRCGHIHKQQLASKLASRLELSSGEQKTRLSYIRLIFSFT